MIWSELSSPLKWAIGLTIFNGLVGLVLATVVISNGYPGLGLYGLAWSPALFVCAWGLIHLYRWARTATIIISGGGWLLDIILNRRIGIISTTLIVFLILILSRQVRDAFSVGFNSPPVQGDEHVA
ncbi:MAG: hypothetical protein ABIS18_00465 [Actinomycetota bacterium]